MSSINAGSPLLKGASHFNAPIDRVRPDRGQPRKIFPDEEISDLAQNLRQKGMLHPLIVYPAGKNYYTIITGERRYRAAQKAGLRLVPCLVLSTQPTETDILGLQLTENLLREELKPVEEAEAFHRLMKLQGWNAKQLGESLGICPSGMSRRFGLLKLSGGIQIQVDAS
jgi:ParB family chromosome partitioning protein